MSDLTPKQISVLKALRSTMTWSTATEVGYMDEVLCGHLHNSPSTWAAGTLKGLASKGYAETMEHLGRVHYSLTLAGWAMVKEVEGL